MIIDVSCRIIGSLSKINRTLPQAESRGWLRSVFVERRDGHAWAGATNSIFAAIQYLGVSQGDNGFIVVAHDGVFLNAAAQSDPDVKCTISDFTMLNFCTLTAQNGYATTHDCAIRDPEAVKTLSGWRDWLPKKPITEPGRAMFLDVDGLHSLAVSSPSGKIVFERVIDSQQPVIVRDVTNPDWLGVFLARPSNGLFIDGAQRPDWSV